MPIHAAALYRSGVLVQITRPERYAIHKLIVDDRRRDGAGGDKAVKDRQQAAFLIEAMTEDRPAIWHAHSSSRWTPARVGASASATRWRRCRHLGRCWRACNAPVLGPRHPVPAARHRRTRPTPATSARGLHRS
ncbi:MAG: GSU2403 family nucleotidyltransferase fold protein [Paracoccaceae bacterium]